MLVFFVCVYLVMLHMCCIIVTRWGGPGGIEGQSLAPSFSALTLLAGSFDPQKSVPDMTYDVFGGTLNLTQPTDRLTANEPT